MSVVLTYAMRLHPGSDLAREQERFLTALGDSAIPSREKAFLADQVASVVSQYRRQRDLNGGKRYAMRRAFEGEGYKITVTISEKPLSRLLNFWRG